MMSNHFFLITPTIFLVAALIGFSRTFYLRSYFGFPDLPIHLYVHGIVLTLWFTIACVQPWLIKYGRPDLHRKLGIFAICVAICVVLTGLWTLILRDAPVIDENPGRAIGNLASLFMFAFCVGFGVLFRRNREMHKRLMLLASIPILAPALDRLARIPVLHDVLSHLLIWFPTPPEIAFAILSFILLLIAAVMNDIVSHRRLHRGTIVGLTSILIIGPFTTYLFMSLGLWVRLVNWVV